MPHRLLAFFGGADGAAESQYGWEQPFDLYNFILCFSKAHPFNKNQEFIG